ncbi:CHASE domain-containing protein [Rhodoferax aquaticus]|uniref:CHASE domain-containing protein n=1 Tax=Rhodoferax aquaticus TaxID=2527691 RepID=UPI00143DDEC3|nr:CHASE domain-containing protein [Rhodoferax aquaticus]
MRSVRSAPAMVLAAGLAVSALGAWEMQRSIQQRAAQDFDYLAQRTAAELQRRFYLPQYGLNGVKGMYAVGKQVGRADFSAYVNARSLPAEFPGVRGIGFVQPVLREDLPVFVKKMRADGAPAFAVQTLGGPVFDDMYIVKYIEPLSSNLAALGLDLGSEPQRRAAAERAIATGEATVSGALTLVQDDRKQAAVVLFTPIFAKGSNPRTAQERRDALVGLLYAPIVVSELLRDLPDVVTGVLDFEMYDSALGQPLGRKMFDANDRHSDTNAGFGGQASLSTWQALQLPGREFSLELHRTAAFAATVNTSAAWLALVGGSMVSLLLALLLRGLATGRERAERLADSMAQEAQRLAKVVQHTSNAVTLADAQGRITWVNPGFTRVTGYSLEEAVGKTPAELVGSGKASPQTLATLARSASQGVSCKVEVLNRAKDGHEYWTATELQPQHDAQGRLVGFMEIGIDITPLRSIQARLETALRENDALLSTLNLHAIVSVADATGAIVDANEAFCDISGYTREELIGKNHRIVNSGTHPPAFWKDMWTTISTGLPWRGQVCNKSKDGHLYWVDTFIAPFIGDDGQIDKYISIRTDITRNVAAQEELRISQERFAFAIEGSGDGVWDWDLKAGTVQLSKTWKEMLGHSEDEIGNDLTEWSGRLHPDDAARVFADVQANLDGVTTSFANEHRVLCKDGSYKWILDRGTVVRRDAEGAPLRMVGTHTDVSLQKATQLALQQATDAAQSASQSKSQFLANMSHEIRTPMNAILGMLTLLRKTQLTPKQADYAAKSEGAARALLGLINEILDFSKIEAGKMTLDPHPFGVDQLLRDLSVILATSVGGKPIEMLYQLDPAVPSHLVGDAMRIQQVLLNLCSNAIKFTERGEVVLSIVQTQSTADAVTLQFSVKDTGIGIAPENQARIFSGFTQAESSTTRRFGGTGLGVAISQRFVNMMGGELELQSALGEGSRFYFTVTLPIAQAPALTAEVPVPFNSPLRVLMVDDNPLALSLLSAMGQSLGWEVDLAVSGEQALEHIQSTVDHGQSYQAVFVDWNMPGLDGWQTSLRIRALGAAGAVPLLVMVTASGREMLAKRSGQEQALLDGYLVKPVTPHMLLEALQQVRPAPTSEPLALATEPSAPSEGQRLLNMRLLVVEDNLNNQQVARELLEGEGAWVQLANHGREGVEAIAAASPPFDVVLMDLQMPVMDGFAATRHVREHLGMPQLPIVAMTANAMASDREACLAAGMNDHVGKPFDLQHLVQVLRRQAGWFDTGRSTAAQTPALSTSLADTAQAAGVDVVTALRRLGGKQEVYQRMLSTFVADLQNVPAQLQAHIAQRDPTGLARDMHTLKGLAATLGADGLAHLAGRLEKESSATSDVATMVQQVQSICEAIAQVTPALQALVQAWGTDATQAPAALAELTSTERAEILTLLKHLALQLADSDMEAMHTMALVQQRYSKHLGAAMAPLEAEMSALEFEAAILECETLICSLET